VPARSGARDGGTEPTGPQGARPGTSGPKAPDRALAPTAQASATAKDTGTKDTTAKDTTAKDTTAPPGPSQLAAMSAATTAALGSAGAATVSAARMLSGRFADWSAGTRERAQVAVDDLRTRREEAAAARSASAERASNDLRDAGSHPTRPQAPGAGERGRDTVEPPVPLLPPSAAEPLTRDQSRMAIGIIVGFLVLAFVLAMWGLSRIPSLPALSSDDGSGPVATGAPTEGDAEATDSDGDGTADAPGAAAPLTFTAASDYDPLGDGAESPEELPNILDGDDSTSWTSEGYRNTSFSGLKAGVGVVLDLGETTSVSEVSLVLPSESAGTIYVTDDGGYAAEGKPLADDLVEAGSFDGGDTVTIPMAADTSGRYVIVWFTEISTGGEQWYRARLAGATATS
jgi:eukaryotic-like serine/threonine-protein kinase